MYVAVCSGSSVVIVSPNESASLDDMGRLAARGYQNLRRFVVSDEIFALYSEGAELIVDVEIVDGKPVHHIAVCTDIVDVRIS